MPTWNKKRAADFRIDTEEQARNWVLELVQDVERARDDCNIVFPDDRARTVEYQRKSYRQFLVKHGAVLGVLMSLYRCGKLGDRAYAELRQRVLNTLGPRLVGDAAHVFGSRSLSR